MLDEVENDEIAVHCSAPFTTERDTYSGRGAERDG
jgi:hypothetical protein